MQNKEKFVFNWSFWDRKWKWKARGPGAAATVVTDQLTLVQKR